MCLVSLSQRLLGHIQIAIGQAKQMPKTARAQLFKCQRFCASWAKLLSYFRGVFQRLSLAQTKINCDFAS